MPSSNLSTSTVSPAGSIGRTTSFLALLLGWTAVLATALAFFGSAWWPLDMLADWRLFFAVVAGVAALTTGTGHARLSAMVFLAAAIVNAALIAPMWLDEQAPRSTDDRVRVISLDVGHHPDVRQAVLDWVNTNEGDVVLLANAGGSWSRVIEQSGVPYRVVNDDPGLTGGTLVLARNDIPVRVEEVPGILSAVDIVITVPLADRDVTIYGVSVERPVNGTSFDERIDQYIAINARLRRATTPTMLIGNLEASRWSHTFEVIATGMVNSEDGFGYHGTYPSFDLPMIAEYFGTPVDNALYTGAITVAHRRVGPNLGADHRPLLVDVSPADASTGSD
jgi:endonuclease/exonuclease/phosphatase (EEP) superfamily protein YafD